MRRKHKPAEYRSAVLDIFGLSSPFEHGVTTRTVEVPVARSTPAEHEDTGIPGLVTVPPAPAPNGEEAGGDAGLVQRLWTATEAADREFAIEDWGLELPAATRIGRFRWRWWPVLLVVLIVGLVLVYVNLRAIPSGQAVDIRDDWRVALSELRADLPAAENAAAIITSPTSDMPQLAEARTGLIGFDTSAATLAAIASRPFPTPPPLASGSAFDPLKPIQTDLLTATNLVTDIDAELADAITYRSLLDQSFVLPPLPLVADEATLEGLGPAIANALATSRAAVRELPIGPAFDAHRSTAQALVTRLEAWQASYLDALRLGDIDAAAELKAEINARIGGLRNTLDQPLESVAVSVMARLDQLALLIADSDAALGRLL